MGNFAFLTVWPGGPAVRRRVCFLNRPESRGAGSGWRKPPLRPILSGAGLILRPSLEAQGEGLRHDPRIRSLRFARAAGTAGRGILVVVRLVRVRPGAVADVGCGDGRTTARLARAFPSMSFSGFDYASSMVENAKGGIANWESANVRFDRLDICDGLEGVFDLVYTTRCLIRSGSYRWVIVLLVVGFSIIMPSFRAWMRSSRWMFISLVARRAPKA